MSATSHTYDYITNETIIGNRRIIEVIGFDMKHGTDWYKEYKEKLEAKWKKEAQNAKINE